MVNSVADLQICVLITFYEHTNTFVLCGTLYCSVTVARGLCLRPQCLVEPRQRWRMPTFLETGGRSTPSTQSSGISATQDLDSAAHLWFTVKQADSGRSLWWNVLMVSTVFRKGPGGFSSNKYSWQFCFSLVSVKARKRIQQRISRSPAASSEIH